MVVGTVARRTKSKLSSRIGNGGRQIRHAMNAMQLTSSTVDSLFGLDASERIAIWLSTDPHEFAVRLNSILREANGSGAKLANKAYAPFAVVLLNAIAKLPCYRGPVYRGANFAQQRDTLKAYVPDTIVQWNAFTSTSTRKESAFGGDVAVVIHSKTGRNLEAYSPHPGEQKVLFFPATRFLIKNVIYTAKADIELEEVGS